MSTVAVRIRHEDSATSVPLCDWEADKLDDLFVLLRAWDIYVAETSEDGGSASGQFVLGESAAWFEVVVHSAASE